LKQDKNTRPKAHEEIWCIKCKGQGHDKDHCPIFTNYLAGGGPMPLRPEAQVGPSTTPALWCTIFHIGGKHVTDNCHLLQKYTKTSQHLFCNFCRSVSHDERTCRSYELMMDWTPTYRVQTRTKALDQNVRMVRTGFQRCERGRGGMGPRRGRGHLIYYNCRGPGHYAHDCTNLMRTSLLQGNLVSMQSC